MGKKNKELTQGEKRKYLRLDTEDILLWRKFTSDELIKGKSDLDIITVTKNTSAGGVLFESDTKFELGELLKIEISMPGWEKFKAEFYKIDEPSHRSPLIVLAHVVRVEVISDGKFDVGVCFSAIDEGHEWALMKYIDREHWKLKSQ